MKQIGVLTRKDILNNKDILYITENIYKYVSHKSLEVILIPYNNQTPLKKLISLVESCDGVVLPGGDDAHPLEVALVKYLHKNDIPTLGICLGAQVMAIACDGKIARIKNDEHKSESKYAHKIVLNDNSLLYKILGKKIINVNSSHYYEITKTSLEVSAKALDGVVEAIEDPYKRFFIGVQWHPEKVKDIYAKRLIIAFINSIL